MSKGRRDARGFAQPSCYKVLLVSRTLLHVKLAHKRNPARRRGLADGLHTAEAVDDVKLVGERVQWRGSD